MTDLLAWVEAHQGTAAWVQAIFSVVTIGVAAFVPIWHERAKRRSDRRRWLSVLTGLSRETLKMAEAVFQTYANEADLYATGQMGDADEYAPLIAAIAAFPPHVLPDHDHLLVLLKLKNFAHDWDRRWRTAVDHGSDLAMDPTRDGAPAYFLEMTRKLAGEAAALR